MCRFGKKGNPHFLRTHQGCSFRDGVGGARVVVGKRHPPSFKDTPRQVYGPPEQTSKRELRELGATKPLIQIRGLTGIW